MPDLIQGALQSLLQQRPQLAQQQQQAQQQQLDTMRTPLPQMSPIQQIVSSYLQKYAANPRMGWSSMASALGEYPEQDQRAMESQLLRQQAADTQEAQFAGDAVKEADLMGYRLGATKPGKGSGVTVKMDKDGNMVVYDPSTQESRVVHSSQRGEYQRIWTKAYEKAVQEDLENPEGYAANVASKVLSQSPSFNPQRETPSENPEPRFPTFEPLPELKGITPQAIRLPQGTDPKVESSVTQQFKRALQLSQDPTTRDQGQAQLKALQQLYPYGGQTQRTPLPGGTDSSAPQNLQYLDQRSREQQKGYGSSEGKGLYEERQSMDTLYGANAKLIDQLNTLEKIYSNPNIPQGQLAGYIQNLRSGLKSLNVDVAPEAGITDFAQAIGTSLSLTQKNADGKNLLPGAMSNYEDQLLQKMAPTLSLTQEGRMALVGFMKQVAQSNLRIASEATQLASENKDMLPSSWYKRKERVMLEEMAKMREVSDQLYKQYGSKK